MGVEKQVLAPGNGPKPVRGQNVTVHCTGYGKNGNLSQKFWSTKDPGQKPFTFKIGQGSVIKGVEVESSILRAYLSSQNPIVDATVLNDKMNTFYPVCINEHADLFKVIDIIRGWDEGVMGMQVGEVARLHCSPDYAYGPGGFPAWGILPNSVLTFEIEVLSLE